MLFDLVLSSRAGTGNACSAIRHSSCVSRLRVAVAAAILILFGCWPGQAQIPGLNDMTSTPIPGAGHDYIRMLDETVDPANGSLSVKIAVPTPKSRGLTLPFAITYNSNGTLFANGGGGINNFPDWVGENWNGWSYAAPELTASQDSLPQMPGSGQSCDFYHGYLFQDPDGGRHIFPWLEDDNFPTENNQNLCDTADFGTPPENQYDQADRYQGILVTGANTDSPAYVLAPDGTAYFFQPPAVSAWGAIALPLWMEDRNGNRLSFHVGGTAPGSGFTVTDTNGRTELALSGFGADESSLTVSGIANPYTITWGQVSSSGFPKNLSLQETGRNADCGNLGETTAASGPSVTSLELPDG